jgi:deoxyribodipyrimidine photo-lyase
LNELIWRDFYIHFLSFVPLARAGNFRNKDIQWGNDERLFTAWREGRTGYPVIDAAMRQMLVSGWMHNRARMLTASFLVKDLLIDWRWGERWFMQHLVDGDPAANNGGWQWTAGTGTDAAPFFRIFNPLKQSLKYDPKGSFIRRWLPELMNVPDAFVHQPWRMNPTEQAISGCTLGKDYPDPIVDHTWARERVLRAFQKA